MGWYETNLSGVEQLQEVMEQYEGHAGPIIDEILHGDAADVIKEEIARLIPSSGRTWNRKPAPASVAMPAAFSQDNGALSVTIAARNKYGYLYFPDDGSNTIRHAGNQQFMMHGALNASEKVINLCIGKLTEEF